MNNLHLIDRNQNPKNSKNDTILGWTCTVFEHSNSIGQTGIAIYLSMLPSCVCVCVCDMLALEPSSFKNKPISICDDQAIFFITRSHVFLSYCFFCCSSFIHSWIFFFLYSQSWAFNFF